MAATAILFLMDLSQKLIRSSEIPGEQPCQIKMQSYQRFISYRAHKVSPPQISVPLKHMYNANILCDTP